MSDPPTILELSLAEAILLVGVLEDALTLLDRLVRHEALKVLDVMGPMLGLEDQLRMLEAKLWWPGGEQDERNGPLRSSGSARQPAGWECLLLSWCSWFTPARSSSSWSMESPGSPRTSSSGTSLTGAKPRSPASDAGCGT
jgi:hypothetical protein